MDVFHHDPCGVALSKIDRGHERDFEDVMAMPRGGLVEWDVLCDLEAEILLNIAESSLRSDPARMGCHFAEVRPRWEGR